MRRALLLFVVTGCSILENGTGRPYAVWNVHGSARYAGTCAMIDPHVAKSGAEGVGFLVEVQGRSNCTLALAATEMRLRDEAFAKPIALPPMSVAPGSIVRFYVAIPFDNRAAWNRGDKTATVFVRGTIDGQTFESGPWTMDQERQ